MKFSRAIPAVLIFALAFSCTALAQTVTWIGGNSGTWSSGTAWSGGLAPGTGTSAAIDSGTALVPATDADTAGVLIIGNSGTGALTISGGSLVDSAVVLGSGSGADGNAYVSGGTWTTSGSFIVGSSGTGNVVISGGMVTDTGSNAYLIIGGTGGSSAGSLTINSGSLECGSLNFGTAGSGSFTMNGGYVSDSIVNSGFGGGMAVATITGGTWATTGLYSTTAGVAQTGTGILNMSGGLITAQAVAFSSGSSTGVANISGGTVSTTYVLVANSGTGTVNLSGSGLIDVGSGTMFLTNGLSASAVGTLNVSGGTLNAAAVTTGSGTGVVNFTNSGTVTFAPQITGSTSVNQTGTTGAWTILTGNNTYTGTTTISSQAVLQIGNGGTAGSLGSGAVVANGALFFDRSDNVTVSNTISGGGSMWLIGSGTTTLTANNSYAGITIVDGGGLVVNGGAINSPNAFIDIGENNNGTFLITGGAVVTDTQSVIGVNAGSTGSATINSGSWINSNYGDFAVGGYGNGTLTINGGYISDKQVEIGEASGYHGVATIAGGTWATANNFNVGYNGNGPGNGTLNINGGLVSGNFVVIGNGSSMGTVNMTSGSWIATDSLIIAVSGTGVLNQSGGMITDSYGTIAFGSPGLPSAGGIGTANISGGTWNDTSSLIVGQSGTGVLNLSGSGVVTVGSLGSGTLMLGSGTSTGILNFAGGTLNAAAVNSSSGTGVVNFTNTGTVTFAPQIAGSIAVNQTGTGATILTGSDTYTGSTKVSAGTLTVNGSIVSPSVLSGGMLNGSGTAGNVTVNNSGTLGGTLHSGTVTINSGGMIAPLATSGGPGALSTLGESWLGGGGYVMKINNFTGTAGNDPGWSTVNITGGLSLSATSGNPFVLHIGTLTLADAAGAAANFSDGTAYALTLATTTAGITGFNASAFTIDTSGVANSFTGVFSVAQSGNNLVVDYKPAFTSWAAGFGLSGSNAAATACPAGDGMPNLMKFALGTDPTQADSAAALPVVSTTLISGQNYLTLTYQRPQGGGANGVTYIVEENSTITNPNTWSNVNVVQQSVTPAGGGLETVVMEYTAPLGSGPAFMRLRVTQP